MMRSPLKSSLRQQHRPETMPAPYRGWNTKSPQAALDGTYALYLDNFFPVAGGVELRKGASLKAQHSNPARNFRSLLKYSPVSGTEKLFAGAEDGLYDVTAGGTVSVASTAATSNEWQGVNVRTAGGSFLWCCNATDKSRVYNGSTWTLLDGSSTPALTGVDTLRVKLVAAFKSRLYLVEKNALSFWYLGVNAIGGAATEYPLGVLCPKGGYLVAVDSWTYDSGVGPDDHLVFYTSEGQAVVFAGYDPSSAANWTLVGVYDVGKPLGNNCTTKVKGDLYVLTDAGVLSMTQVLRGEANARTSVSDNIEPTLKGYASTYGSVFGWGLTYFSRENVLFANVPLENKRSWQCVQNVSTGAWCRFTGWDAEAMLATGSALYFSVGSSVYQAWEGAEDHGAAIIAKAKLPPNAFHSAVQRHFIKLLRVNSSLKGSFPMQLGLARDYGDGAYSGSLTTVVQNLAAWDEAVWDQATWPEDGNSSSVWKTVNHFPGHVVSLKLRIAAKGVDFTWYSTDYILQQGNLF